MSTLITLIFLCAYIAIGISFLSTLANTVREVREENRLIDPMNVWYTLIPFYNLYYYFVVVKKVPQSVELELKSRNIQQTTKATQNIGLYTTICRVTNFTISMLTLLTILPKDGFYYLFSLIVNLILIVLFIVFWLQITQYKKQIRMLRDSQDYETEIH